MEINQLFASVPRYKKLEEPFSSSYTSTFAEIQ